METEILASFKTWYIRGVSEPNLNLGIKFLRCFAAFLSSSWQTFG